MRLPKVIRGKNTENNIERRANGPFNTDWAVVVCDITKFNRFPKQHFKHKYRQLGNCLQLALTLEAHQQQPSKNIANQLQGGFMKPARQSLLSPLISTLARYLNLIPHQQAKIRYSKSIFICKCLLLGPLYRP